jgi:hypothetical protein
MPRFLQRRRQALKICHIDPGSGQESNNTCHFGVKQTQREALLGLGLGAVFHKPFCLYALTVS